MANFCFSVPKRAVAACGVLVAGLGAGCSSVEHTSIEKMSAVQTITPLPKPGTELTAYALPTPDGTPTASVAALTAEAAALTPTVREAAPAIVATADVANKMSATSSAAATPTAAATAALPASPATITAAATEISPRIPQGMVSMAMMDSDFDTGEPVGLETLVATRMIVPMPKPELMASAFAKATLEPTVILAAARPKSSRPELDRLIAFYAKLNGLPEALVHRVVKRESTYNPRAYHRGNYGLMQIRYNTARGLGYDGPAEGLFDAETNLKFATKYLRGAWMVADNENEGAVRLYASGYYNNAKRKGMLETIGLK